MREFGDRARPELELAIRKAATDLYEAAPTKKPYPGSVFAMDNEHDIVMYEVDIRMPDGERFRLNTSTPESRPPFEWIMEITADMGVSEYIKHYLIRDNDIVLAQRKELTVIDDQEAELILADLATARAALDAE